MKELFTVWRNTRMVVLVGVSAALYVALLLPFKAIQIVPGFTELRPGAAIPPVCSMLFGPAGAWGAAIGNLIADMFGMFGLGSIFGFFGNLALGYIPYRMWKALTQDKPTMRSPRHYAIFALSVFAAGASCGVIIGWGVHFLGFVPFSFLGNFITLQNVLAGLVLGAPLLLATYSRLDRMGLTHDSIMDEADRSRSRFPKLAIFLVVGAVVGALVVGNVVCVQAHDLEVMKFAQGAPSNVAFGLALSPFMLVLLVGLILL